MVSAVWQVTGEHPVYVRTEYITLWELIRDDLDQRKKRPSYNKGGVIILGQPGIGFPSFPSHSTFALGKSLFLKYALFHALRQRIDAIHCVEEHRSPSSAKQARKNSKLEPSMFLDGCWPYMTQMTGRWIYRHSSVQPRRMPTLFKANLATTLRGEALGRFGSCLAIRQERIHGTSRSFLPKSAVESDISEIPDELDREYSTGQKRRSEALDEEQRDAKRRT